MTKFKVGDTVKIIGNCTGSYNDIGDIGIITEEGPTMLRVTVQDGVNLGNWSDTHDLELVNTQDVPIGYTGLPIDMNLKEGDVCRLGHGNYSVSKGILGSISVEMMMQMYSAN